MIVDIALLVLGFVVLIMGGNWLLKSSVDMAVRMGMSRLVVGLTVVSFATSAPELIVSVNAALNGASGIALGNVIGSNIANIGLVLGVTAMMVNIRVPRPFFRTDYVFLMFASVVLYFMLFLGGSLNRLEGMALILFLVFYVVYQLKTKKMVSVSGADSSVKYLSWPWIFFYLLIGGGGLWLGSDLLVGSARNIAVELDIPESVIGLTVVAIGTSVPELAASVIAALKGEKSISFGNLIGSNIFNIFGVLGLTAVILPIPIEDARFLSFDIWWMLGFALLLLPLSFSYGRFKLRKLQGAVLISLYILYVILALV
ncbi:MAG: calcium/sodium antiporter [Weeksellaceae bacterium]|nr:calcium/sodium antiporter [Weeksellaceae bacterium]